MASTWFSWVVDPALQGAMQYTLNGGIFSQDDARRAMAKLWKEGADQVKEEVGEKFYEQHYPTKRRGGRWRAGSPVGVVDHYTAGISARGTLKWFSSRPRGLGEGNSSSHVVISRDGTIYSVVDPLKHIAWHAPGANSTSVGIEHVNAGVLLRKSGGFFYLKVRAYPTHREPELQEVAGNYWEPYTAAQIVANIVFKRWLIWALDDGQARRDMFVDHHDVDPSRKKDCGPLWPLDAINDLVFSAKPIAGMQWLKKDKLLLQDVAAFKDEVSSLISS